MGQPHDRVFNFSAGPAVLPEAVLRQAQHDIWNVQDSGIGICEHSHRGQVFNRVITEAEADCRKIADISDDYAVLFLQGGASLQFAMAPMNFLRKDRTADYLHTGEWTKKAIADAKLFGNVNVAFDGGPSSFDHVPAADEISASDAPAYTFYCSNNTIYGTQYPSTPSSSAPLICDASSEILSRPIEVSKHALIFAGAQKNLGPAGCTLVIIRKDFLNGANTGLPQMLDYRKHVEKGSRLNTPPAFAIYMMGLVFKWILDQGGLAALADRNQKKAAIMYDTIESSGGFYKGVARPDSRSLMNVTFRTPNDDLDKKFIEEALANDMSGLKGHRSAGGLRASIYNAFPKAGCEALAQFMKDFAQRNG
ncbi:MAG: 3-phosphoserine/phosphohydroxythreonine transaminase [Planctomycetes bacterium]|nr:3-phosphoserine/phosphohydroxythreonine transaminase [Planctomycetota bacterium]